MKLILAIINNDDSANASAELNREGFSVTRLSTTGGFLMVGNTTLLIGTDDDRVPQVKEIIKRSCAKRKHVSSSTNSLGRGLGNNGLPQEVTVGGATVFVLSVDETDKL
jgi:uncharacterized protein YaaQ